jgi:hypothetical protein
VFWLSVGNSYIDTSNFGSKCVYVKIERDNDKLMEPNAAGEKDSFPNILILVWSCLNSCLITLDHAPSSTHPSILISLEGRRR